MRGFRLGIRKHFLTGRVVKHWNRLPREAFSAPSMSVIKSVQQGLLDFNFFPVIKILCSEKALASSISHIGLLYWSKTTHRCAVHTASCMTLQTLLKVLIPLPDLLSFTASQQLLPVCCSGDIWPQLFICSRCGFGYLPASFDWRLFSFSVLCCWCTCRVLSSHPSLTCPSQQCALMLVGRKLIAWGDLTA